MNIRDKLVVAVFGYEINLWPSEVRGRRRFFKMIHIDTIFVDLNEIDNDDKNQPMEGEVEMGELASLTTGDDNFVTERTGDDNLEEVVTERTGEDNLEEVITERTGDDDLVEVVTERTGDDNLEEVVTERTGDDDLVEVVTERTGEDDLVKVVTVN